MIVHCKRDGLLTACQLVGVAVPTRTTKPILTKVKAIAEGDHLTLMATDLEIGIRYTLQGVRVDEEGEAILPVLRLVSILRESMDDELTVEADERRCRVSGSSSEYEMPSENPADFPDIPTFSDAKYYELAAGDLQKMIRRTEFAAGKDETRFALAGVLWEVEDKKARLVATDSKRMALTVGPAVVQGGVDTKGQSHLVPTKAMSLLERNLSDGDADQPIRVCLRPNEVLFQTEKSVIYSRLKEGRYPPYRDIIPKKANAKVALPVEGFLSAVRQAAIMTDDESKRVLFHFTANKLTLEAQGAATGRSKVEMKIEYEGPAIDISFDPQYLIEMLRVLEDEPDVTLELVDGMRPALFKCGDHYLYLVMPLT